ncbi:MAG: CheR family methyltransferase [Candidatus Cyclobacteriaceae bacterium M2_1C_046]
MTSELDIADLKRISEVVKQRYGYDFTNYAMSSFKRRINRILEMQNLTVDALVKKLSDSPDFLENFLNEITVNVTEMFRDPSFWRVMRDDIIPAILLNHKSFKIWHAGCSSGEEVFSMCILLHEMGILDNVQIIATDLDSSILTRAKSGVYSVKNMDLNEKNYIRFQGTGELKDYYKVSDGQAVFDSKLMRNVSFRKHDLVMGDVFNKFDLILCRNVMIYFNQKLQNEVLIKFHESLFKYGYLAIGSKESLIWCDIVNKFLVANNEEKIYKKIKD